jgi:hypothetical protein
LLALFRSLKDSCGLKAHPSMRSSASISVI